MHQFFEKIGVELLRLAKKTNNTLAETSGWFYLCP